MVETALPVAVGEELRYLASLRKPHGLHASFKDRNQSVGAAIAHDDELAVAGRQGVARVQTTQLIIGATIDLGRWRIGYARRKRVALRDIGPW